MFLQVICSNRAPRLFSCLQRSAPLSCNARPHTHKEEEEEDEEKEEEVEEEAEEEEEE